MCRNLRLTRHFIKLKGTAYNVVGYPAKQMAFKNEFVVISARHDHIGLAKKAVDGDFINNGANDDALWNNPL
jgi:Zn-dependent M28 family amino/carboxypeptidase